MDTTTETIIREALAGLPERGRGINHAEAYYRGAHAVMWDSGKYAAVFAKGMQGFRLNVCRTVIDTLADRLQITGWTTDQDAADDAAERIWRANRLDSSHGRLVRDTLLRGAGHVIVWQNDQGVVEIHQIDTREVWAAPHQPAVVRAWIDTATATPRVTVYYPDRVERFAGQQAGQPLDARLPDTPRGLHELTGGDVQPGTDARPVIPNTWRVVPVFTFLNDDGTSELADVIPLQDALNKQIADMAFSSEREALPNRWASGIEQALDPQGRPVPMDMRPGETLVMPPPDARAGQFPSIDIQPMRAVADSYILDVARVTGIPPHVIAPTGSWPSGEALKTAEARQRKKADDRVLEWGAVWRDAMALALRMTATPGDAEAVWAPTGSPVSGLERAQEALLKLQAGVPRRQVWRELGYSEEQITVMMEDAMEEARMDSLTAGRAFDAGAAA